MVALQLAMQEVGEQRVVAVAGAVAQRHQQAVEAVQPGQQQVAVVPIADRIGQGGVEAFQQRGLQQELLRLRRQVGEDLLGQVVGDAAGLAGEAFQVAATAVVGIEPQRGELQRGRPALGVLLQPREGGLGQGRSEHRPGFGGVERQGARVDPFQTAAGGQPRQRQRRRRAAGQQQVQAGAAMLDQARDQRIQRGSGRAVVVVQDQHHRPGHAAEHAEHGRHRGRHVEIVALFQQRGGEGTGRHAGDDERHRHVGQEAGRLAVFLFQRQPGGVAPCRGLPQALVPLRQQRGLAEAGRRQQQGQRQVGGAFEALEQPHARHRIDALEGRFELVRQRPVRRRRRGLPFAGGQDAQIDGRDGLEHRGGTEADGGIDHRARAAMASEPEPSCRSLSSTGRERDRRTSIYSRSCHSLDILSKVHPSGGQMSKVMAAETVQPAATRKAARAAASVASITASSCALETKPAS